MCCATNALAVGRFALTGGRRCHSAGPPPTPGARSSPSRTPCRGRYHIIEACRTWNEAEGGERGGKRRHAVPSFVHAAHRTQQVRFTRSPAETEVRTGGRIPAGAPLLLGQAPQRLAETPPERGSSSRFPNRATGGTGGPCTTPQAQPATLQHPAVKNGPLQAARRGCLAACPLLRVWGAVMQLARPLPGCWRAIQPSAPPDAGTSRLKPRKDVPQPRLPCHTASLQVHGCKVQLEVMGSYHKRARVCGERTGAAAACSQSGAPHHNAERSAPAAFEPCCWCSGNHLQQSTPFLLLQRSTPKPRVCWVQTATSCASASSAASWR